MTRLLKQMNKLKVKPELFSEIVGRTFIYSHEHKIDGLFAGMVVMDDYDLTLLERCSISRRVDLFFRNADEYKKRISDDVLIKTDEQTFSVSDVFLKALAECRFKNSGKPDFRSLNRKIRKHLRREREAAT